MLAIIGLLVLFGTIVGAFTLIYRFKRREKITARLSWYWSGAYAICLAAGFFGMNGYFWYVLNFIQLLVFVGPVFFGLSYLAALLAMAFVQFVAKAQRAIDKD